MQRAGGNAGTSKRKRRLSDSSENIENEPIVAVKRRREDRKSENETHTNSTEERVPFAELSVLSFAPHSKDESVSSCEPESPSEAIFTDSDPSDAEDDSEFFMPDKEEVPSVSSEIIFENDFYTKKSFGWLSTSDFWSSFCDDSNSPSERSSSLFENHPALLPRMRSVLLEWLVEVCDVYNLHRETYFLAIDYLDRFLSIATNVKKTQLQLIGVTCLLISSKYEEIFPPKVSEFAYITDGACTEEEIVDMEMAIVKSLDWRCMVLSANGWLSVLLQLIFHKNTGKKQDIMLQQYSVRAYNRLARLLDLASLDEGFLSYSYKILAVSAIYVGFSKSHALLTSGLELSSIIDCVAWMEPFWETLLEKKLVDDDVIEFSKSAIQPTHDFSHTVLKHTVTLELLEAGQAKLKAKFNDPSDVGLLTPPLSSKKKKNFNFLNFVNQIVFSAFR